MRLRIEYADHNEPFGRLLPQEGVVEATPRSVDSSHEWHLLRLDSPLHYDGADYSHFLLAARIKGQTVGTAGPAGVFILLVPASADPVPDGFSYKRYHHVAWGEAHVTRT